MKSFQSQTHYEVLEVSVGATAADIRHAYERLSQLYSDDQVALYGMVEPARAAALRSRLKEALEVLTDDARRDAYDVQIGLPPREAPRPPPRPQPAARPRVPSPAGASAATGWGAFAWVTPAASAPPAATSTYTYAPAPMMQVAAPPPALASAPAVASPVPAATQAPEPGQRAHEVPVAVSPRDAPPGRDAPGDAQPTAASVESAAPAGARGSAPLPSAQVSPASPPLAEPPPAPPVPAPLPSIPVSLASAPLAGPPAPAPAPTPAAPPFPSIPVPLTSAPPPDPAPTPAAPSVEVLPNPILAAEPVSAPAALAPVPDPLQVDAPMLADESVEVSIVPTRASPSREFKVEQRPRPYEIPEGVEINGDLLRQVRMARGLTLAQLGERTRIGVKHLENVEADRYDALPASVYLRGILMSLARELGLDGLRVSKSYLTFVDAHRSKG